MSFDRWAALSKGSEMSAIGISESSDPSEMSAIGISESSDPLEMSAIGIWETFGIYFLIPFMLRAILLRS